MDELNYFTCTLGEAARHGLTNPPFENINSFFDHQAIHVPENPAAGFFVPAKDGSAWATKIYNFRQIHDISNTLATILENDQDILDAETVALLCPSSEEFMFVWLALIRLDKAVLLLAPQCQPDAIQHLCKECEVEALIYHKTYEKTANDAISLLSEKKPFAGLDIEELIGDHIDNVANEELREVPSRPRNSRALVDETAYIHHTSGTSSGLPKPIHQAHNAAVGALPKIPNSSSRSAFTTTPLYHGGIADAFRSWTSDAMIWLYPGKDVPITSPNVVKALEAATEASRSGAVPKIAYFSSVPYVLQLLEEDTEGLQSLQRMEIVGVGGAALPNEVGDRLVKNNVHLVSRFGSSECGFLMSSHRDYAGDKAWQFLHDNVGPNFLRFEPREDDLSELVVLPTWPHRATTNREDGSFATADLFEPHESIPNAWRYHSRADSQLTLITGKKFDPAPLEGALADSNLVADALIFGDGRPYPGVLLFRSQESKDVDDNELVENIWQSLEQLNMDSQDHARIAKDMIKPMPWQEEPLEKSSKGTLIRKKVEARFTKEIQAAYAEQDLAVADDISDDRVEECVLEIVGQTLGRSEHLDVNTDLFAYGVDSIAAMRIRGRLQALVGRDKPLPATIVETCGSVKKTSSYLVDLRNGRLSNPSSSDDLKLMPELVDQYARLDDAFTEVQANGHEADTGKRKETIILTGATGALGAHVFDICTRSSDVGKIVCLIRGEDEHAAKERLDKALKSRKLGSLDQAGVDIEVIPAKLNEAMLGLEPLEYERLAREATVILHLAWEVNFRMNLRSFRTNSIAGKFLRDVRASQMADNLKV